MLSNATATIQPIRRATYPRSASERRTPAPPPRAPARPGAPACGGRRPGGPGEIREGATRYARPANRRDLARLAVPSRCGAPGRRYFNKTTNLRLKGYLLRLTFARLGTENEATCSDELTAFYRGHGWPARRRAVFMTAGSGAARLPGRLAAVPPPRSRRGARRRGRAGLSDGPAAVPRGGVRD